MPMRRIAIATLSATGLAAGMIALAAPAVMAQSACEKATGGSTSSLAYTGKNSGNSTNGYTCAYQRSQGKTKLKPWQTKSFTSNTAKGYYRMKTCTQIEGKNISSAPAYAQTAMGSSWTQTNTNWDFSKTGHVGSGIFWATDDVAGSQYTTSPCNWGGYPTNQFWQTSSTITLVGYNKTTGSPTFDVAVTPEGNAPAGSDAFVFQMLGDSPDPTTDKGVAEGALTDGALSVTSPLPFAAGDYTFYAVYGGSGADQDPRVSPDELTPPQRGWLPSLSGTISVTIDSGLNTTTTQGTAPDPTYDLAPIADGEPLPMSVVNDGTEYPKTPQATCESGERPIHVEGFSPKKSIDHGHLTWTKNGAKLNIGKAKDGTKLNLQVVCRPPADKPTGLGQLRLGTVRADELTQKKAGPAFAGPGKDEVTVKAKKGSAYGALGRDRVYLKAANTAADGGPGADMIKSNTKPKNADGKKAGRVLLIGGPGPDTMISGKGPDRVNARDGEPNDTVECRGSKTRVLADKGDTVMGNCKWIKRK
jgi:hypothetical protein